MPVAVEKSNPWVTKDQHNLKRSQPDYLPSQNAIEMNQAKFKARFDWNDLEDKRRVRDENNCDNLLFFKSAKDRKYALERSRYRSVSRHIDSEVTFTALVKQWREETRGMSSTNQMSMHPAYQQIIGMGKAVIPLLLRELEKKSGHWFWALKSISREDPVPPEYRGKVKEMTKAWLEWGRQRGYRW
ncbi:hypothetical protein [Nostoc sp. NOS(2021)]|uniref:hypothetical protein n=1 Tax=Nostoc sp. NOS(2021) TaxID=2815407 RepID=UPI0025E62F6B|nr:hypothetical protein [Nostoc sp. NOS(2021)]